MKNVQISEQLFVALAEYADMVSELAEMDKKFQAWDEDEMNDAEAKYYLEVSARVAKKLLEIAE